MSLKPTILRTTFTEMRLPRDLGNGLLLRQATPSDAEPLAQFNGRIHGRDHFDAMVAAWTRDFVAESHPTCGPSNVTLVEEQSSHKIVSTMCLIPQTWTYAGIPFGVGRPEAVGTDPEFRRRGLVRAQFDVHHARSAAMGHLVQAITGIPWYYRQYGYEYALELGGGRMVPLDLIPPLKEGQAGLYRLRPLTESDLALVQELCDRDCARSRVACPRPESLWRHLTNGYARESFENRPFQIIEADQGRPVGYLAPSREMGHDLYTVNEVAVIEGQSLREVMPDVLRALKVMAEAQATEQGKTVKQIYFQLGTEHPLYDAIRERFAWTRAAYGWYVRVADLAAYLKHVTPALEERLARSPLAGYSGELRLSEYTHGLRLAFVKGKLESIQPWQPEEDGTSRAAFPPNVFLQLLFGYRSLAEIRSAYADAMIWGEEQVLLDALFPKQSSYVVPVG